MERFLFDTAIWIDIYEDRKGFNNEPLGKPALELLLKAERFVIANFTIRELETKLSLEQINGMFKLWEYKMDKILATEKQEKEAKEISFTRNVPSGDALHAIIARDHDLILIARDKHFKLLKDISPHYKPEDLI